MKFNTTYLLLVLLFLISMSVTSCMKARVQIDTLNPETSVIRTCDEPFTFCRIQIPEVDESQSE